MPVDIYVPLGLPCSFQLEAAPFACALILAFSPKKNLYLKISYNQIFPKHFNLFRVPTQSHQWPSNVWHGMVDVCVQARINIPTLVLYV